MSAPNFDSSNSLLLFDYSTGLLAQSGHGSSCISCSMVGYLLDLITILTRGMAVYLSTSLAVLLPIAVLIWIGFKTAALLANAGENGVPYIKIILKKLVLFSFAWMVIVAVPANFSGQPTTQAWTLLGPDVLNTAYKYAAEVRSGAIAATRGSYDSHPDLNCDGRKLARASNLPFDEPMYAAIMSLTCSTERSMLIPLAAGEAMIDAAYIDESGGWFHKLWSGAGAIVSTIIRSIYALVVLVLAGLVGLWLLALIVGSFTRILIIAAFGPLLFAALLFEFSRGYAMGAIRILVATSLKVIGIGIVSVMVFFISAKTVDVFNNNYMNYQVSYPSANMTEITLSDGDKKTGVPLLDKQRVFLKRVETYALQNGDPSVPMPISSPWVLWILATPIIAYGLGNVLIRNIESALNVQGLSSFADSVLSMAKTGGITAGMAGITAANVAAPGVWAAGKFAGRNGGAIAQKAGGTSLKAMRDLLGSGGGSAALIEKTAGINKASPAMFKQK